MRAVLTFVIMLLAVTVHAQFNRNGNSYDGKIAPEDRLYFGGGGGFGFGTEGSTGLRYSYWSINPLIGINITEHWSAGPLGYYQSIRYPQLGASLDQFGGGVFTKYKIKQLFGWVEYDFIDAPNVSQSGRKLYTRFPVGLGFQPNGGGRAAVNLMALYDVTYNRATSPFNSPFIIRVIIIFGAI